MGHEQQKLGSWSRTCERGQLNGLTDTLVQSPTLHEVFSDMCASQYLCAWFAQSSKGWLQAITVHCARLETMGCKQQEPER